MIKIYKISSENSDQVYVGSTKLSLETRMYTHTSNINKCSSRQLIDLGNYKISLIEEVSVQDRYIREQYWIDQLDCVNKHKAFATEEDIKERDKQWSKKYYQKHKEEIADYNKQYYQDHKEEVLEKANHYYQDHKEEVKQYQQEHKEEIADYNKQYYQKHKEYFKQYREEHKKTFTCECGKVLSENSRSYHMNSKLHHKRMKNLQLG